MSATNHMPNVDFELDTFTVVLLRPGERADELGGVRARHVPLPEGGGSVPELMEPGHPLEYDVEYPDRDLNRLTTAFRPFTAIPIWIVLGAIGAGGSGLLAIPPLLMIVFRQKYPRWWYDFNLELLRFQSRVGVYLALMDDRYPSTDERQGVRLEVPYPDAMRLNRWLPLVKWLLAIPHYIVLLFLYLGAVIVVIVAWFAILFTGRFPRGLFDYLVGVGRWTNRVIAYAFILVTDEYPPFRLEA